MKNIELDVRTFQENNQNKDTKKATVQVVRLFNEVMYELSQNAGHDFVPLDETPIEMLPEKLCCFFMILKKKRENTTILEYAPDLLSVNSSPSSKCTK